MEMRNYDSILKYVCTAWLLLVIGGSITAQTSVWKVSKDGFSLYLGGTVHILRDKDYPLPAAFDTAYSQADLVFFESDMDSLKQPLMVMRLMEGAKFEDDSTTLRTVLSDRTYGQLNKLSTQLGLPLDMIPTMKPSMVMVTLTSIQMRTLGISLEGVDRHFMDRCKADKVPMGFLESCDLQIKLLTNMGAGYEDQYVKQALKDHKSLEEDLEKLIDEWKDGTGATMRKELAAMRKEFPLVYQDLLVNRNNSWMPKLIAMLTTPETEMVLVGALHLHGDDGLLSQLQKMGFELNQVL